MRVSTLALACLLAPGISCGAASSTVQHAAPAEDHSDICPGFEVDGVPVRWVEFMGFFASEAAAVDVAALIDENYFQVQARQAADGIGWVVMARYRQLPSLPVLEQHRTEMKAFGSKFGGDGLLPGCISYP